MKKYVALVVIVLFGVFSGYYSSQNIMLTTHINEIVTVSGVMNIAAAYAGTLLALCACSGWLAMNFNFPSPVLRDKGVIIICLVITPILTYITHVEIEANIKGYVECKDQRELWSRYSSRTYAKTEALCLTLK